MRAPAQERRKNLKLRQLLTCAYGLSLLSVAPGSALSSGDSGTLLDLTSTRGDSDKMQLAAPRPLPRLVFLSFTGTEGQDDWLRRQLSAPLALEASLRKQVTDALAELDTDTLHYQDQPLSRIRDGFGFDYALPDGGAMHFNLYTRRQLKARGLRVRLNPVGRERPEQHWSLGASLDIVRREGGAREITVVPQLLLDLDGLFDSVDALEAALEYGHWQGGSKAAALDTRVAQVVIRLRF